MYMYIWLYINYVYQPFMFLSMGLVNADLYILTWGQKRGKLEGKRELGPHPFPTKAENIEIPWSFASFCFPYKQLPKFIFSKTVTHPQYTVYTGGQAIVSLIS